jgi:carbamoyl-phosphate synthase large subunit
MFKIIFQDNHIHSTYSDGTKTLDKIFEYNQYHDKLDLIIADHVDKNTDWFDKYDKEIKELRKRYKEFSVKIGCEVKIINETGELNTTDDILKKTEVVIGSVHFFEGIKQMSPRELLEKEFELTKLLASNKKIDILGHPFSMGQRFFDINPDYSYVQSVYKICLKNGIKFEYNKKTAPRNVRKFVLDEVANGNLKNFSFGSDMHKDLSELGSSAFDIAPAVNILVTGAGAGVGQSIIKSAKLSSIKKKIIAVDNSQLSAGLYVADAAYLIPLKNDPNFIDRLIEICQKESVDLIFPGTDVELEMLAFHKKEIEAKTSAKLVISNLTSVKIADDKWKTFLFLKENKFPYPKSWLNTDIKLEGLKFPVIVKPRMGARSIGVSLVKNKMELTSAINSTENPIIQEYLPQNDEEYTCGSFFYDNKNYGVIIAKRWLRNGDTYKAIFSHDRKLEKFISEVGKKLHIFGPCNFQLRKTRKGYIIFEINCRFSGTSGAASYLGFNVVNAIIQKMLFGRTIKQLSYKESYMFRYWNEIFSPKSEIDNLSNNDEIQCPVSEKNIL